MAISKGWKWEVLSKDDEYWNTPDFMIHYLDYRWKKLEFKDFLDIGCGMGRHCIFMSEQGYNVKAFDYSKYVIDVVKDKVYEKNLNVNLTIGDMSSMPYENDSIDCMIAIDVLYNSDKEGIKRVLKEMHRVLRVGGETYFNIISDTSRLDSNEELFNGNEFYYVTEKDFEWLFEDFNVVSVRNINEVNSDYLNTSAYCILLKKVHDDNTFNDDKLKESAYLI